MPGEAIRMASNGRLLIPASLRAELGMEEGGSFVATVENGSLRLDPPEVAIRRAQERLRPFLQHHEGSLSDELIAERRREAERE